MKFSTHVHCSQTINPNDFGDPLTFYLVLFIFVFIVKCLEN